MTALLLKLIKAKVIGIMFRKFKARAQRKAMTALRGKLTYASVAGILVPILGAWVGVDLVADDLEPIYQGVLAGIALFGKWRASRGYA